MILQVFQEREKRGQALLQYSRIILGVVSGHTSRHRGEARHSFEKELEILVVGFPLAWPLHVRRWLTNGKESMWPVSRSDSDVRARDRGSRSMLTSSLVAIPCLARMVSTVSRGESMYSFRAGKVVFRWLRFFSPTLANRAVLRVLLAML